MHPATVTLRAPTRRSSQPLVLPTNYVISLALGQHLAFAGGQGVVGVPLGSQPGQQRVGVPECGRHPEPSGGVGGPVC